MLKPPIQRLFISKLHVTPFIKEPPISSRNAEYVNRRESTVALIRYIESHKSSIDDVSVKTRVWPDRNFTKMVHNYWSTNIHFTKKEPKNYLISSINHSKFMEFIEHQWFQSPLVRILFRKELIFICNNLELVNNILEKNNTPFPKPYFQLPTQVLGWCIDNCIKMKDIVCGIDIFLLYFKYHPNINPNLQYARQLISALKYQHPKYDNIHIEKFKDLYQLFLSHNIRLSFSSYEISLLCNKVMSPDVEPTLSKTLLNILLDSQSNIITITDAPQRTDTANCRNTKIKVAYVLIDKDYLIKNPTGIYLTWIKIKNTYDTLSEHDSRILYKVFKSCYKNKAYRSICQDIISKLKPVSYCNDPLLLPAIIRYITSTKSLVNAQKLMKDMETYTTRENRTVMWSSRRFLSSLLKMQLEFFEVESVDKIIKQITDTYGSLAASDYAALVSHVLGNTPNMKSIKRALKFVDSIPLDQRQMTYSTLTSKLIEILLSKGDKVQQVIMPIINEILIKSKEQDPFYRGSIWPLISSLYFKTLFYPITSKTTTLQPNRNSMELDLARLLYIKGENMPLTELSLTINPFASPHPNEINLRVTKENKLILLRLIAHTSLRCSRKDIFMWANAKMYNAGVTLNELIFLWNMTFKHQFRQTTFHTIDDLQKCLKEHGIEKFEQILQ